MVHESSPKGRVLRELSRSRQSSPYDDNAYTTATGTSFHDVLHSTPLRESPQHALPLRVDQLPDPFKHDDNGSTDMSIEVGRGVRGQSKGDVSSEGIFNFGNDDSQYEVTATPPIPPRNISRKTDGSLRKEASVRRATESAGVSGPLKRTANGMKARAVSDMLPRVSGESNNSYQTRDFSQSVAPTAVRNTRFVGSRQHSHSAFALPTRFVAGQGLDLDYTPQRTANLNATMQSTTFTANQSFMLPNIPDLTEIVSGVRKDATPVVSRGTTSRSRFTSGSSKAPPYRVVESLPVPDEEKVIIASLQTLKDRISELEAENMEAHKRAHLFEGEVFDLRNKLQMGSRRPVSEAGSDEETLPPAKSSKAAGKVEASLKAVQDRFNRSERKVATAQLSAQRVIKERDALITQIAAAYFSNEELIQENEAYHTSQTDLVAEIGRLQDEVEVLKTENETLKAKLRKGDTSGNASGRSLPRAGKGRTVSELQHNDHTAAKTVKRSPNNITLGTKGEFTETDLASRIEREVQRYRDEAAAKGKNIQRPDDHTASQSMSKPKQRRASTSAKRDPSLQRTASAPPQLDADESEWTTELDLTRKSQQSQTRRHGEQHVVQAEVDQDITVLSDLDEDVVAKLRKKIEEEHKARRLHKKASGSAAVPSGVRRKSSLKGINDILHEDSERFSLHSGIIEDSTKTGKTVRVQSPHISEDTIPIQSTEVDAGDISILSNTSRRRRRASSTEGLTSAFIIPDITIHPDPQTGKSCIAHNSANCTACAPPNKEIPIPTPVLVSDRVLHPGPDDPTDATLRPSQPPALALATVIKHLEDEITHLKLQRDAHNRAYNRHDPAISRRRRLALKARLDALTTEIERRSDQVYALYDVVESQKVAKEMGEGREGKEGKEEQDVEETLMGIGIDPVELSGWLGRGMSAGGALDGVEEGEEWSVDSDELPWEGLSEVGSE